MSRGRAASNIHLLDGNGKDLSAEFARHSVEGPAMRVAPDPTRWSHGRCSVYDSIGAGPAKAGHPFVPDTP
jgi:hypothetical protein